jgi:hypothetical protein
MAPPPFDRILLKIDYLKNRDVFTLYLEVLACQVTVPGWTSWPG